MASTTYGQSLVVNVGLGSTAIDPIDWLGASLDRAAGYWVANIGANIVSIFTHGEVATVNGSDGIPLLPNQWTWIAKPASKPTGSSTDRVAVVPWTAIAITGAVNLMIVADTGAWHPMIG
jgi:hypothetical protein